MDPPDVTLWDGGYGVFDLGRGELLEDGVVDRTGYGSEFVEGEDLGRGRRVGEGRVGRGRGGVRITGSGDGKRRESRTGRWMDGDDRERGTGVNMGVCVWHWL